MGERKGDRVNEETTDIERVREIFLFLQGEGTTVQHAPNLTPDQAWTVIRFLGNKYYKVPDFIDRCDICGELYDSEREGSHDEHGAPYSYCDDCREYMPTRCEVGDDQVSVVAGKAEGETFETNEVRRFLMELLARRKTHEIYPELILGEYKVRDIDKDEVQIGCTRITWKEIDRIAPLIRGTLYPNFAEGLV
jgi:hypothetical protein